MAELLLGEDGRGYELARRLEGCGAWRTWLGDTAYNAFVPALASPAAWESFLTSRSQLPLQFRARALLYDKASAALFLPLPAKGGSAAKPSISDINPAYSSDSSSAASEDRRSGSAQRSPPRSSSEARSSESVGGGFGGREETEDESDGDSDGEGGIPSAGVPQPAPEPSDREGSVSVARREGKVPAFEVRPLAADGGASLPGFSLEDPDAVRSLMAAVLTSSGSRSVGPDLLLDPRRLQDAGLTELFGGLLKVALAQAQGVPTGGTGADSSGSGELAEERRRRVAAEEAASLATALRLAAEQRAAEAEAQRQGPPVPDAELVQARLGLQAAQRALAARGTELVRLTSELTRSESRVATLTVEVERLSRLRDWAALLAGLEQWRSLELQEERMRRRGAESRAREAADLRSRLELADAARRAVEAQLTGYQQWVSRLLAEAGFRAEVRDPGSLPSPKRLRLEHWQREEVSLRQRLSDLEGSVPWIVNEELGLKLREFASREAALLTRERQSHFDQGRYEGYVAQLSVMLPSVVVESELLRHVRSVIQELERPDGPGFRAMLEDFRAAQRRLEEAVATGPGGSVVVEQGDETVPDPQ